jgi:putative proteasome-type protease
VRGEPADILLVYPEGNYIRASEDRPFLQIGEAKYGKAWLDLAVRSQADLRTAAKIALSSMVSTALANLSVGPPYDLGIYERESYQLLHARIEGDSPYLTRLSDTWREHLLAAVHMLPDVEPGDITVFPPDHES